MKTLLLTLLLVSTNVLAGTYEDAMRICHSMKFSSSRTECANFVLNRRNTYFDEQAISTCQLAKFDSDKIKCVRAISGKIYDSIEINECRRQRFSSDIPECLHNFGRLYYAPTPPQPRPNPPRPPNQIEDDYVRGQTQRWMNLGNFQAPKGSTTTLSFNLDPNTPLTEIKLNISKNNLQIKSAVIITASNLRTSLPSLEGKFPVSQGTAAFYQVGRRQALRAR